MRKYSLIVSIIFVLLVVWFVWPSQTHETPPADTTAIIEETVLPEGFQMIELRSTPIDLASTRFVNRTTTKGVILKSAWYDAVNSFLVVGTNKTFWQYCGVSTDDWAQFGIAPSFDKIVNADFKKQHLCTVDNVPLYADDAVAAGFAAPTTGSEVILLRKLYGDEDCVVEEYCEAETESGETEEVYIYQVEGDHLLGIGEDDIAVEVYIK